MSAPRSAFGPPTLHSLILTFPQALFLEDFESLGMRGSIPTYRSTLRQAPDNSLLFEKKRITVLRTFPTILVSLFLLAGNQNIDMPGEFLSLHFSDGFVIGCGTVCIDLTKDLVLLLYCR
ncbi:hypothetical protein I7I51_00775, partial [Histoplasma capsulatum]